MKRNEIDHHELVFDLILNDFANLNSQLLKTDEKPNELNDLANKMNNVFLISGLKLEATVSERYEPVYVWQMMGDE